MRRLVWLVVAAVVLYGGFWVVASRMALTRAEAELTSLKADGRADYAGVSIAGFPSRFDLTVEAPALMGPDGAWTWSAPFIQILALAYRPNHVIAVWPNSQTVTAGHSSYAVESTDMRASAVVGTAASLPLDHLTWTAETLRVAPAAAAWTAKADTTLFATRRAAAGATAHDLALVVKGLSIAGAGLPSPLDGRPADLNLDATATFLGPLDRTALAAPPPLTGLAIREARIVWGPMNANLAGTLDVGPDGTPTGRVELTVTGWPTALKAAVSAGLLDQGVADALSRAIAAISAGKSDSDTITLPLDLRNGQVYFASQRIGAAPAFPGYRQ